MNFLKEFIMTVVNVASEAVAYVFSESFMTEI